MKRTSREVLTQRIVLGFTLLAPLWGCGRQAAQPPMPGANSRGSFLNARLRGAIDADLAWSGAELQTEGGARPDGSGIRVSLAGPLQTGGQRIRLVFGMAAPPGAASNRVVPTNVTMIVEGAGRVFATLGDDKCSVDALLQQPIAAAASPRSPRAAGDYWVIARGFCIGPASTLAGSEHVLLSRFDFRGRIHLDDIDLAAHANAT
jgi:hypothetical protein